MEGIWELRGQWAPRDAVEGAVWGGLWQSGVGVNRAARPWNPVREEVSRLREAESGSVVMRGRRLRRRLRWHPRVAVKWVLEGKGSN